MSRRNSGLFWFLVHVAFFASGAACLIAEVTWNRMLIVVVGNSVSAAAMIIAVFMGGLGLGSFAGGRAFGRRQGTLRYYVLLEMVIGILVLVSPFLFGLLSNLFTSLAGSIASHSVLTAFRLVVTVVALAVPAFLMGMTFPAIIAGVAPYAGARGGARIGYLYSINTLGAATGCFVAGYHLLLEFGVRTTLAVDFGLYALAAASALVASTRSGREATPASPRAVPAAEPAASPAWLRRNLYAATFGTGFVALAYEVLLTRLSILYLGNTISVFPLVLTAFLLGTGASAILGTWLYGALRRARGAGDRLFGITATVAGVLVLATPYMLLSDRLLKPERPDQLVNGMPLNPWPILGIIVLPTIFIGGLLPIAIRMLQRTRRSEETKEAATLYALNTAGGLLGAAVASHHLVPAFGMHAVLVFLALVCVVAGLASWPPLARRPAVQRLGVAAGVIALVAVIGAALPRMVDRYAARVARATRAESASVLLVREGKTATVTVIDQVSPALGSYRDMYLNGVEEASTRYWHTQLFKLLGILPVLIHEGDQPKEALVIAFGAGITAGSVLASDEVASLDVVDLNPDIEGINDLFRDVNGDVYHQQRFHFHNNDGRNYLVTSGRRYDLIIGDSTHPRAYDSWILYTEEFYRSVERRLRPGGIFAQWVPVLGSMRGDLMRIHLNTFRRVFPHATCWYIYGSDQAFLLATPEELSIDAARLRTKLARLPAWFRAGEYQIDSVPRVAGFFWLDETAMDRMVAGETRTNRDDKHYFDKQSAVWPLPPERQLPAFQTSALAYFENLEENERKDAAEQQEIARLVGRYAFYQTKEDLFDAWCRMPENGDVDYFMRREFADRLPDRRTFCLDREIRRYRAAVAVAPDNPLALNALADCLIMSGKLAEAMPLAERAAALAPANGMVLDTYGWGLLQSGDEKRALEVLRRASASMPDHPVVLYHLGAAFRANGDLPRARACLRSALGRAPFDGAEDARELLNSLDPR